MFHCDTGRPVRSDAGAYSERLCKQREEFLKFPVEAKQKVAAHADTIHDLLLSVR
jgi:hypothetical protein